MIQKIEQDVNRFKQIVKGRIKKDLQKHITNSELIGKKGKDLISIPLPQIEIPQFRHGRRGSGGVGQGEGEPGDAVNVGEGGDAGASAALQLLLGRQQRVAQLGEGAAAEQRRQQQPIRLQGAADLHQRAGQIVDEVQ